MMELLKTVAGFAAIFGLFIAVQMIVRKQSGCRGDKDPLDYMAHGCANCARKASGQCSRRLREDSHELA